jgi:hypothetical protein
MSLIAWPTLSANSYYNVAAADAYFTNRLNSSDWTGASSTIKEQSLTTITTMIDREVYEGAKTSATQSLEFPRTSLTDKEGDAVLDSILPPDLNLAVYEGAIALIQDSTLQTQTNGGTNIKKLVAGTASIEYFHSTSTHALPQLVLKYLQPYLEGDSDIDLSYSYGTDEKTGIETYKRNRGFS